MENILNLSNNFPYIINDRHSKVMCAKYGRSRMNSVCTISPVNLVGLPAKIVWLTTFFLKKKSIFV